MSGLTPEVEALALAAIRAARWVPEGPLTRGCVQDSGEAVRQAVSAAVKAVRAAAKDRACPCGLLHCGHVTRDTDREAER